MKKKQEIGNGLRLRVNFDWVEVALDEAVPSDVTLDDIFEYLLK